MLLQVAQDRLHNLEHNKDLVEVLEECNVFGHHSFAAGRRNFGAGRRRFSAGRQNFAGGRHRVDYVVVEMVEHLHVASLKDRFAMFGQCMLQSSNSYRSYDNCYDT